jgi:hypothetical protein
MVVWSALSLLLRPVFAPGGSHASVFCRHATSDDFCGAFSSRTAELPGELLPTTVPSSMPLSFLTETSADTEALVTKALATANPNSSYYYNTPTLSAPASTHLSSAAVRGQEPLGAVLWLLLLVSLLR